MDVGTVRGGGLDGGDLHLSKEGLLVRLPVGWFAIGLAGMLLLGSCHRAAPGGVFIDPAFGPLIPPDTQMLAGLRLEKLRDTQLYKTYAPRLNQNALADFKARTGLDPQKDILEMLVVTTPKDALVMVRGHFTAGELEPKLDPSGKHRTSYKGYTLIGDDRYAVVFMKPGVLVAGPEASLQRLLDRGNHSSTKLPEALAARLAKLASDDQLWLVDDGGLPPLGLFTQRDDVQSLASNLVNYINGATMGIQVDDGMRYSGTLDCVSAEGVKRVRDALRGMIGLARLTTKSDQSDMLRLYDAIEVTQADQAVHIEVRVAPDLVGRVVSLFSAVRPQMMSPEASQ
jgi:hypothetical protein